VRSHEHEVRVIHVISMLGEAQLHELVAELNLSRRVLTRTLESLRQAGTVIARGSGDPFYVLLES
jgi:DNA-binding HxlR family transcriptional regulator